MARHCRGRCGQELPWYSFRLHWCAECARRIVAVPRESKAGSDLVSVERFLGPISLSTEQAPWAAEAVSRGDLVPGLRPDPVDDDDISLLATSEEQADLMRRLA